MKYVALLLVPIVLFALITSVYAVDANEFAYVTEFGRNVLVLDGGNSEEAGLHFKPPWPIQSVLRLDRRIQSFDLPGSELLTRDPKGDTIDKTLTIDAYVCWRIADRDAVDRFVRTVGSIDGAQRLLSQRITSELGAAVADLELEDLVSTEVGRVDRQRETLRQRLLNGGSQPLAETALRENGIEVIDIRVRRVSHPTQVREEIFNRIRSERGKKATEYTSEGERLAANIRSAAEAEVSRMKADAEYKAKRMLSEADAQADRIRNEAARADPKFYSLLRKMEDYQRILGDGKSTLLLSTHRELFDLLYNPPDVVPKGGKP